MNNGRTHWDGCWREHHECAIAATEYLRAKLEAWTNASQYGHPEPCTLGPLCPYCEIERLRAKLAEAERDATAIREHVQGCVDAAYAEGLIDRLSEQDDAAGGLRDLVQRRLLHVTDFDAALAEQEGE